MFSSPSNSINLKVDGIRGGGKPLPPPDDDVHHRETVIFQNPNTGIFQASHEPRNVITMVGKLALLLTVVILMLPCTSGSKKRSKKALTTVHLWHNSTLT